MDTTTLAAAVAIAAIAGIVRGITGFGGAMVMAPPLALLLGPRLAVPVVLLLESIGAAPMLVRTHQLVTWKLIGVIVAAACVTVPLGVIVLIEADPDVVRRAIAATVLAFAVVMLRGWRYTGRPRLATSIGLGAVSGGMMGATSISGPPIILYLLAGPDPIETTRANLTLYITVTALIGLAVFWYRGAFDAAAARAFAWLAPAYLVGLAAGMRLFARFSDARFRQFTLVLLIGVSVAILVA